MHLPGRWREISMPISIHHQHVYADDKGRPMFGRSPSNALAAPPNAKSPGATEVLRVWAAPGQPQQLVLKTTWKEPGAWGLLLADVARHAAKAYANDGLNEAETLARIWQFAQAEMSWPTDDPKQAV